uniref:FZ domain-containing protein n=1 Tax=Mesocestoides corti TaxID=53468 RepID=A0A5K3G0E8_MESCO
MFSCLFREAFSLRNYLTTRLCRHLAHAIPCRSDFLFPLHEDTCDILGKAGGFGRERASAGDVELKTSP